MPPFLIKSLLSLVVILCSAIGVYTMFEIYGRTEKRQDMERLRKLHSANGLIFTLLAVLISLMCVFYIYRTGTEPSLRGMFHSVFSISILLIVIFKVLVVRIYRQFYTWLQAAGIILAFVSFTNFAVSGGYYLLVTEFGSRKADRNVQKNSYSFDRKNRSALIDPLLVGKGRELYEAKCNFCHDPLSNKRIVGPGHKGILRNPTLPVSGRPAVPENIAEQIKAPYKDMPSFSYLTDEEIKALISYMDTL